MKKIVVLLAIFAAVFFFSGNALAVSPETARTVENPAGVAIVGAIRGAAKIAGEERKPANEKPWDVRQFYVPADPPAGKPAEKGGTNPP